MLRYALSHRLASVALTLGVTLGASATFGDVAAAQDQPVAFVHGLFWGSSFWQPTANFLQNQYQIAAVVPTLGWGNTFETQANNLQTALGGRTHAGAFGHSNGGLVERQYVRQFGGGTGINRGYTIATPHRGAQLAQYALDGTLVAYANDLYNSIADPINFYYYYDPDFAYAFDNQPLVELRDAAELMGFIATYFVFPIVNDALVPAVNSIPVGQEMPPTSAFVAALNSSSSLSAEQANLATRVSTATGISYQNPFFRVVTGDPGDWAAVRRSLEYFAELMYNYYSAHPDPFLQANAWRWLPLFERMYDFDVQWHFFIGSLESFNGYFAVVDQQDGVVPLSSQAWPGATVQRNLLWPTYDIAHGGEQISVTPMLNVMRTVLGTDFSIPVRPPPPSASISGPGAVEENAYATWTGGASGGVPPYSYQWTVDGVLAGNGGSVTDGGWPGGSSHTIGLTVTDASGYSGYNELGVYVTYAGGCLQPPCP